jgi:transcriptional regulator with XRE-family HTH domain
MRKYPALAMANPSNNLIVQCRMALGLTQKEFGDIFGRTKRTVQRWEDHGATLLPSEAEALARVLLPVRPDLAADIAAGANTTLDRLGLIPDGAAGPMATSDPIDSVVRAAAAVMGVTPDAIRAAIAAAFLRAREEGLDVQTVAERLNSRETS